MKDQDLKNLFKEMKYEEPSQVELARWKRLVRHELKPKNSGEWARLAVACLVGIVIGATVFKNSKSAGAEKNIAESATIERVYINLE